MLSWIYCKVIKNSFFIEHLRWLLLYERRVRDSEKLKSLGERLTVSWPNSVSFIFKGWRACWFRCNSDAVWRCHYRSLSWWPPLTFQAKPLLKDLTKTKLKRAESSFFIFKICLVVYKILSETYLEPFRTTLIFLQKRSTIDVWKGSKYAPVYDNLWVITRSNNECNAVTKFGIFCYKPKLSIGLNRSKKINIT